MTTDHPRFRATVDTEGDTAIVITREFSAPRALVWEVLTTPEHVARWYGCGITRMVTCEIDLRVGGRWRYVTALPDGQEHAFSGEYVEIVAPERVVTTETYENVPGATSHSTMTLEDLGGDRTLLTTRLDYPGREFRDGHLESGMEYGMNASFDEAERLATTLAAA